MKLVRRRFLYLATAAAALPAISYTAAAQAYPTRPVRLIVPLSAGSAADILARLLATKVNDSWGQPVVVENPPGAGRRAGKGKVWATRLWFRGCRIKHPLRWRAVQARRGFWRRARALQGTARSAARHHDRAYSVLAVAGVASIAVHQGRQTARFGGHDRATLAPAIRSPDCCGSWRAGLRVSGLVGCFCTGPHAGCGHQQNQQRDWPRSQVLRREETAARSGCRAKSEHAR
jgi:hypothetical protein